MTASRSRRRSAAYAALALALCGSLALTGCNSKSKKSKKTSSSSSSSSYKKKKHKIIGGGAAAGAGAGAAANRIVKCRPGSGTTITQASNPDMVILTFTNPSSSPCRLFHAPLVRFDNAAKPLPSMSGVPGELEYSKIDVPARGKAYAVIPTNTAAAKGTKKKTVDISFMGISEDSRPIGDLHLDFTQNSSSHHGYDISVGNTKVTTWVLNLKGAKVVAEHYK
ncbi:DUF4232 domain-containing protein [Streptomyces piniterrae]|uniref:DUF4232 domain-containing protein n=1 Tax=Streptomyces piniterrae TaxID=2571125 RepID=A0A4U0N8M4_9ACTN|nr:DUF4232 domain-containing protein [Streptomyces piniterrae]TJZ50120.1 DUF4232 domain-containing protein [Streptomyces piniterrae]